MIINVAKEWPSRVMYKARMCSKCNIPFIDTGNTQKDIFAHLIIVLDSPAVQYGMWMTNAIT